MAPLSEFEKAWLKRRTEELMREDLYYAAARMIAMQELERRRDQVSGK
ncbi:MAG: hypothetical protein AAFV47_13880 [Pseudomonadota bacterium]